MQHHFNSSSDFGIGLSWRGYTVHDAANCLRRFLNYLPEPVIIFPLYEPFRSIASTHGEYYTALYNTHLLIYSHSNTANNDNKVLIIKEYQSLIDQLPIVNQYLLFYLLDLLALFTQYAKYTKMNSMALASVFTPGILLNPEHSMSPEHYKLSQHVVQFLIEHQEHFHLPQSTKDNHTLTPTIDSSVMRQHLLRANTVPAKLNRFGPNDPLQIVNK